MGPLSGEPECAGDERIEAELVPGKQNAVGGQRCGRSELNVENPDIDIDIEGDIEGDVGRGMEGSSSDMRANGAGAGSGWKSERGAANS